MITFSSLAGLHDFDGVWHEGVNRSGGPRQRSNCPPAGKVFRTCEMPVSL